MDLILDPMVMIFSNATYFFEEFTHCPTWDFSVYRDLFKIGYEIMQQKFK